MSQNTEEMSQSFLPTIPDDFVHASSRPPYPLAFTMLGGAVGATSCHRRSMSDGDASSIRVLGSEPMPTSRSASLSSRSSSDSPSPRAHRLSKSLLSTPRHVAPSIKNVPATTGDYRVVSHRRSLSAPDRLMRAQFKVATTLVTLPTEMLLEIVGFVGSFTPIHHSPGSSALINLSVCSKRMRDVSYRLKFRGLVVDMSDLVFPGKFSTMLTRNNDSDTLEGVPEEVSKTSYVLRSWYVSARSSFSRSFAIKCRAQTASGPTVNAEIVQRAAKILFHVVCVATRL
ncbi:hypothetical protein IWX90DRAFT_492161 [Phyllosticta citrichinensis]|uniref:F-box domain-containing protein n=1 Tax=Phyllosticta citrichinensis TaxID=1130410 RepID=A0ABR1Y752_9PEZI